MTDKCVQTAKQVLTDRQIEGSNEHTARQSKGCWKFPAVGKCDQKIRLVATADDRSSKPDDSSTFLAGQVPDNTGLYRSADHLYEFITSLSEHTV